MADNPEIQAAFDRATLLSDRDRQAYLQSLPGDLRATVEQLLSDQTAVQKPEDDKFATRGFDKESSAERLVGSQDASLDLKSPIIGPYKLLQRIGQGGMGSVFMAEQSLPVRRRVALKLIKAGMGSKEIITRFEAERQALAMMDHQNIAKVLDAGTTDDGRPFFVMELVNGIPITEYCDKYKLSLDVRLDLFMQSCRAIQHAHQKGVIHRDIKPSNVLVTQQDGVPVVKVIEFGLAKALHSNNRLTDKTLFTEFGQVVGTLQYMSPEQAEMNAQDIDTRSDVYSLGILLYELLTGSTPIETPRLKQLALDRILAAIRDEETPRPSHRLSSIGESATGISERRQTDSRRLRLILKGDLDWIAMKALDKDRARRYDSPAQLAEDVQRYLNSEAIIARQPTWSYRLRKFVKKNRTTFMLGMSAAILFPILISVTVGLIVQTQYIEELQAANGEIAEVQQKVEVANTKAQDAIRKAEIATATAAKATQDAEIAKQQGEKAKQDAKIEVEKAKELANLAKAEAEKDAIRSRFLNDEAQAALALANTAAAAAAVVKVEAETALKEKYQSEIERFTMVIEHAEQLGDFDSVVRVAQEALEKASTNPLLQQKEAALQKTIEAAIRNGGNARIRLLDFPNSASISADGTTVVVYSSGLENSVSVYRNENGLHGSNPKPMRIPVTLTGKVKVTVSNDGRCFCLAAATENQVWQLYHDEDQFEQLPTNLPASAVEAGWTFFSPSGQHLYVVGNDASATVEIFSLANRRIERLLRKPLVEKATIYFPIHDVVLLPDETALIVQFRNQPCFEYRIAWSSDGTPSFKQLGINAPQLKPFKIDGITQSMNQPKKLFIDANSQRLGMTSSDTVLFLHRVPDAPADKFSFAIPGESPAGCEMLKATYEVMDVQFSKDRQRIATRHDDGSVELWDFDGKDYTACKSDGLFEHRPQNGRFSAGLRGHLKEVGALSFANGDADRLLTVSADQSIRTWQISTYQALALQMQRIRDLFELEPSLPPDGIPERNTE